MSGVRARGKGGELRDILTEGNHTWGGRRGGHETISHKKIIRWAGGRGGGRRWWGRGAWRAFVTILQKHKTGWAGAQ